jgi:polyisoprenoid-binding protein YceI
MSPRILAPPTRATLRPRSIAVLGLLLALSGFGPALAASYQIDPVHSSILFKVKHFGAAHVYGRFNQVSGTITYDAASAAASAIKIEIPTDSIDTANQQRDDHLKSADFFNAKQFPVISFTSKKITAKANDSFEVVGDLTLHGVTKEITAEAVKTGTGKHPRTGKELLGFETHVTIKRSDFGMAFMAGPVSDQVDLILAFEAGEN